MTMQKRRKIKRAFKTLLRVWLCSAAAMAVLWFLDLTSAPAVLLVWSLPVVFFGACAFLLPDTPRRHTGQVDSDQLWDDWRPCSSDDSNPLNVGSSAWLMFQSTRHDDRWSSSDESGSNYHSCTIVNDINFDGTYNVLGTGVSSSGLHDW
jgi:hypothetical protein